MTTSPPRPEKRSAPSRDLAAGRAESLRRICAEAGGVTHSGEPCTTTALMGDGLRFSHSPTVSDVERKAAWRRGGLATMAPPDAADVPVERHQSRAEVARARDEVYALVKARAVSPPVGQTLLTSLRDADAQRDRAEALQLERKGRRAPAPRLQVTLKPWTAPPARRLPRALAAKPIQAKAPNS